MTEEEDIFAYIDGELEGDELARIEAVIGADAALQTMVAQHRALAARLQDAFSTVLDAPVPTSLVAARSTVTNVQSMAEARLRRERRRAPWDAAHWAAMAATLIAGLIGGAVFKGSPDGPVAERGGQLVASGSLDGALSKQLASTQGAKAPVRIGLTFRNHQGAICRSFSADAAEGVACREGSRWQLQGLLVQGRAATGAGDYRMAASAGTAELIDSLMSGEAMDQAQERAALAGDWAHLKRR
jgi:hypothetical protein